MENIEIETQKKIKDFRAEVEDISNVDEINEILKNNFYEFEFGDNKYKIIKPSFKDKKEVNTKRILEYSKLLKDQDCLLEKDLIKIYLDRGIDIKAMDREDNSLRLRAEELLKKLGKLISEDKSKEDLDIIKDEISDIIVRRKQLSLERINLMDSTIESQINIFTSTYMAYLVTYKEVEVGDQKEWKRAWNSYEEFLEEDELLVNQVCYYSILLSRSELPNI